MAQGGWLCLGPDNLDNSLGCLPVPQPRDTVGHGVPTQYFLRFCHDVLPGHAYNDIGALGDGYRPLGIVSQSETWHS